MQDLDNGKFYLIETNTNPGLGIRDIVPKGKDPEKLTVEQVVKNCKRRKPNKSFWDNIGAAKNDMADFINCPINIQGKFFNNLSTNCKNLVSMKIKLKI